jgi:hypothetical protein
MITSTYSRIVLGLILGMLASSFINAQNQISDEALLALAKQKQTKIKPEDYIKFLENFWNSTKDIFIKERIKWWSQSQNKEELRKAHNQAFDYAHSDPEEAKRILGNPNISREEWMAKFDKEWDPKIPAEDEFREAKSAFSGGERTYLIEEIKKQGLSEIIKEDLTGWSKEGQGMIFRQQLKQWLDKY